MVTITVERVIAAPREQVFDWLADSSNYTSAPLALRERRVRDGEGAPYGRGAIREITAIGAWFREEITQYQRPEEFGYLILRSFPRFEHRGGRLVFEERDARTRVTWTTSYDIAPRWGGRATAKLLEPMLRWSFLSLLDGAARSLTSVSSEWPDDRAHAPFRLTNRSLNPLLRAILRSPLHALLDRRLALITFTGRTSGNSFTIPVLYRQADSTVEIPVEWPQRKRWWRNLRSEAPVTLRLRGREVNGDAVALEQDGNVHVEVRLRGPV